SGPPSFHIKPPGKSFKGTHPSNKNFMWSVIPNESIDIGKMPIEKSEKRRCTVCLINEDSHEMRRLIKKCICIGCGIKYMKLDCFSSESVIIKTTDSSHLPIENNN